MIFVITEIVCIPTGTSSALIKNRSMSSSIVSHPGLGSDPPFGSDRESGYDTDDSKTLRIQETTIGAVCGNDQAKNLIKNVRGSVGYQAIPHALKIR